MEDHKEQQAAFFIGWQEKAPKNYVQTVRAYVILLVLLIIGTAFSLVITQKGFANSLFELGKLSTMEGILVKEPIPLLKMEKDGKVKSVFLVGFGKAGAEGTISIYEREEGKEVTNKKVQLRGTLIQYGEKTAFELTEGSDAFVKVYDEIENLSVVKKDYGAVSLKGEILDPKCALGVMKPGYGKPHRSCAINCIQGGITPIFRIENKSGEQNFCLMLGPNGEPIHENVLQYVADQTRVCGKLEQQDDWLVLYVDPFKDIVRLAPHFDLSSIPICN